MVDHFNLILFSNEKYFNLTKTVVKLKQLVEINLYMAELLFIDVVFLIKEVTLTWNGRFLFAIELG